MTRIVARPGSWPARWQALPVTARGGGYEVRARTGALPRAWIVDAAEVAPRPLERLAQIDPRQVAVVDRDVGLPATASSGSTGSVTITRRDPDDVALAVHADRDGLVVLADRFSYGWTATVDDVPADIARADFVFRGVRVPAGTHRVDFHYTVPGRDRGLPITIAAAALATRRAAARGWGGRAARTT